MTTATSLVLNEPLLSARDEIDLATRIEAGVIAQAALANAADHDRIDLETLVQIGRAAWQKFWAANLRLAMRIASDEARHVGLPIDDVFQDTCLGLAEAMMRWDCTRGIRFSTFAYPWLYQRANQSALTRGGQADAPLSKLRAERRERAADDQATVVPVSPVLLHSLQIAQPGHDPFADTPPWWFLHLNQTECDILTLRFGGSITHTRSEVARILGISIRQVRRIEASAIVHVRALLASPEAA